MKIKMPHAIAAYVEATNERDIDTFRGLFTQDAVVHDEGQQYRGVAAIKRWLTSAVEKYRFFLAPVSLSQEGTEMILTATLSGEFPGSPLAMRFHFVLREGKISKLDIRG
jgi:ketosteroid isomerase-like protein